MRQSNQCQSNGATHGALDGTPSAASTPESLPAAQLPPRPLKSQLTGTDLRAERLVRLVRQDVEALRTALDTLSAGASEMTAVDPRAVLSDPAAAGALPPALLVRTIIRSHEANEALLKRLGAERAKGRKREARFRSLKQDHAYLKGRLRTLDQVVEALHSNLEDLRLTRRELPEAPLPARLPPVVPGK